jgi:hypothetical protein
MKENLKKEANKIVMEILKWAVDDKVSTYGLLELRICLDNISEIKKAGLKIGSLKLEDGNDWINKMTEKVIQRSSKYE